jgi:hypothetical protein
VLRFGIWSLKSLQRIKGKSQPRRQISVNLYDSLNGLPEETRLELGEKILFWFATPTRVSKRTHRDRFPEFDDLAINYIREMAKHRDQLSIHDVGVSNGHTAVELYYKLKKIVVTPFLYVASDGYVTFNSITQNGGGLSAVTDPHGNLVQVICPPFVFNTNHRESFLYYPLNRFILFLLLRTKVKTLLREYNRGSPHLQVKRINLIAPECASLAREAKDFQFMSYDILGSMDRQFDVVRAMNVLNSSCFSPLQISTIVTNFLRGLTNGGLLITGSNLGSGSTVDGSIFRKEGRKLVEVATSGLGSPVREIILQLEVSPD